MRTAGLSSPFLSALGAVSRAQWSQVPDLDAHLADAHQRAAGAWPRFTVEPPDFAAWLGRCVGDDPPPPRTAESPSALGALGVVDLYLTCGCTARNPVALAAFETLCSDVVPAALRSMNIPAWQVDEVAQRVRQHLLVGDGARPGRLLEYLGRGALRSWLRAVALRTALNFLQQQKAQPTTEAPEDEERLAQAGLAEAPELAYMRELYRGAFQRAFRRALGELHPAEGVLLRQYHVDGLNLEELGALYGRHGASISRRLSKAREALRVGTRAALNAELGVSDEEIDSIFRLLGSKLELGPGGLKEDVDED